MNPAKQRELKDVGSDHTGKKSVFWPVLPAHRSGIWAVFG